MIIEKTLKILEYDKIMQQLAEYCVTESGAELCAKIVPTTDIYDINLMFKLQAELDTLLVEYMQSPLQWFSNATGAVKKADIGSGLTIKELLQVNSVLAAARVARTCIDNVDSSRLEKLKEMVSPIVFNKRLEDDLTSAILSETELADNASGELFSIRKSIRKCNQDIKEKLESYIRSSAMQKYLQDSIITIRNDRYVIPVKQESKGFVHGLVHDQSSSGATVYIEPMAIVELNNALRTLIIQEAIEIERILKEFSKSVGYMADGLFLDIRILTDLDILLAKNKLGYGWRGVTPSINSDGIIDIKKGRHPLLDKQKVVPISINLGDKHSFVTITGANTGGKTVTLKTVGLFCMLAMSGIKLPAEDGTIVSVFDNIFCDIGDEQSIENNLSTFSSHIKNLVNITNKATLSTLVLLDEVGGGTDPDEGSALAIGIIEYLINKGAKGVVTTHYGQLKEYCLAHKDVVTAGMEFNYVTLEPTYKLVMNACGSSNALDVATRLGLDKQIIDTAKHNFSIEKKNLQDVLREAELIKLNAESERSEYEQLRKQQTELNLRLDKQSRQLEEQKEKLQAGAKLEAKHIINQAKQEAEEFLAQLKTMLSRGQIEYNTYIEASKVKNKLADRAYADEDKPRNNFNSLPKLKSIDDINVGDSVFVTTINSEGKVLSINKVKSEVLVSVGSLQTAVKFKDLRSSLGAAEKQPQVKLSRFVGGGNAQSELNLLGQDSMDAIYNLDNFIDQAVISGLSEIRIVHGVGTGKLQKVVTEHLRTHKNIAEFRFGKYGEGERGVTIAKLK